MAELTQPAQISITTPAGLANYPYINKPDTKFKTEGEFKCGLILDASEPLVVEMLSIIDGEVEKAFAYAVAEMTAKGGKHKAKAKALKAYCPYEPEYDEEGEETGNIILKTKRAAQAKNKKGETFFPKVSVFDTSPKLLKSPPRIIGGTKLKLNLTSTCFSNAATDMAGISLRLEACQIIALSEYAGQGASNPFGEEADGFVADDGGFTEPTEGYTEEDTTSTEEADNF